MLTEGNDVGKKRGQRWEKDIHKQIGEKEWQISSKYILDVSSNIAIRGAYYKIRNRWYLTPSKVHWMFPDYNPIYVGDARKRQRI